MGCVWLSTVGFILYEVLNKMELKLFALSVLSLQEQVSLGHSPSSSSPNLRLLTTD